MQQQAKQQPDPTPWPDLSEVGAEPYFSPKPSPSVSPLGAKISTPSSLHILRLSQNGQHLSPTTPTFAFTASSESDPPPHYYAAMATKFLARIQEDLRIEDIKAELTRNNYKEKMHKLLCWEEKAHIEILGQK